MRSGLAHLHGWRRKGAPCLCNETKTKISSLVLKVQLQSSVFRLQEAKDAPVILKHNHFCRSGQAHVHVVF